MDGRMAHYVCPPNGQVNRFSVPLQLPGKLMSNSKDGIYYSIRVQSESLKGVSR